MEHWKDVPGYEGVYQVSDTGRVKSLERIDRINHVHPENILKNKVEKLGYQRVHLSKNGNAEYLAVHRLVAQAFVHKENGCDIVNHLDNNPSNNEASNLEWTTYKGNMQHAAAQGRMHYKPENLKRAQESKKIPVVAISKSGKRVYFESQKDAGRVLGIGTGHIAASCRKDRGYKTTGGFSWEYA